MYDLGYYEDESVEISDFLGKVFTKIEIQDGNREIHFYTDTGEHYKMYHMQDCCEDVYLEDGFDKLEDLLHQKIDEAEEVSQEVPFAEESGTWTFYKLGAGYNRAVLRWVGFSNGYYSESVSIERLK